MRKKNTIAYSDGDIESFICDLLGKASDLSSVTDIGPEHYDRWAVRYHLSSCRGSLLRPFDLHGLDVLELGAGMGGVSRVIAESAKHLTLVEGTERRYKAAQARLRDLGNWEGFVANIQDFSTCRTFDVVCLIGVLEYSELYIDNEQPFLWTLQHLKRFLKDDGVAVVALENRNGLKYFCGAGEDHTGGYFDGICGYSLSKTPRTFSYKQMRKFFEQAGFDTIRSFFPHPDYKLPRFVLTEELLAEYPKLSGQIMATYPSEDYLGRYRRLFPEALAWESLAESGLLADMANSFLFLAANGSNSGVLQQLTARERKGELAWGYSSGRNEPVETVLYKSIGGLESKKKTLSDVNTEDSVGTQVFAGDLFSLILLRKMRFEGIESVTKELLTFFSWSFANFSTKSPATLKPEALDALPHNTIRTKDGFYPFDLEWKLEEEISKSWYVYRVIFVMEGQYGLFSMTDAKFSRQQYYEKLCLQCAVCPDFNDAVQREKQFQTTIRLNEDKPKKKGKSRKRILKSFFKDVVEKIYRRG